MAITGLVPVCGMVLGPKWLVGKFTTVKATPESLPIPTTITSSQPQPSRQPR